MLEFLGIGGCFSKEFDNNSAFFKVEKTLFLIDCGGTVFKKLKKQGLLEEIENIYVIITHFHLDHVGSLSDLIFYLYILKGIKVTIIFPERDKVEKFMDVTGVGDERYNVITEKKIKFQINNHTVNIENITSKHSETVNAYSYIIQYNDIKIYYSGDSRELPQNILQKWKNQEFDYIYHDCTSSMKNKAHMQLGKLKELFPKDRRKNVYCMHIDNEIEKKLIESEGFQVPSES